MDLLSCANGHPHHVIWVYDGITLKEMLAPCSNLYVTEGIYCSPHYAINLANKMILEWINFKQSIDDKNIVINSALASSAP